MHMTGDPSTISLWHSWSEKAQCGMRRSMLVLPLLVCACCSVLRRCYVKRGIGPWNGFMDLGKWCGVTPVHSFWTRLGVSTDAEGRCSCDRYKTRQSSSSNESSHKDRTRSRRTRKSREEQYRSHYFKNSDSTKLFDRCRLVKRYEQVDHRVRRMKPGESLSRLLVHSRKTVLVSSLL